MNYVIRSGLSLADRAYDTGSNYTSKDAEMIARAQTLLELGVVDGEI